MPNMKNAYQNIRCIKVFAKQIQFIIFWLIFQNENTLKIRFLILMICGILHETKLV